MPVRRLTFAPLPGPRPPGVLRTIAWAVGGALVVVAGLALSIAVVAVGLVVGAAAWGYLAWKTREVRRAVREHAAAQGVGGAGRAPVAGRVIEGEAVSLPDEPR